MKKVVLTSFLACVVAVAGVPSAFAQDAPAGATSACPPMADAEYKAYTDATTQTALPAKAVALESYLSAFPQSCVKQPTLVILMLTYYQANNPAKVIETADRVLQLDPNNPQALLLETIFRRQAADALPAASDKQAAYDALVPYAEKGLVVPKPASMSDADFKTLQGSALPVFDSAIGYDDLLKKDPGAIDAYKKELALEPPDATKTPGSVLQDEFYLGDAYFQQTPPDYLNCTFYASRAVAFAPEPYKTEFAKIASYCYKKYHGNSDGYDAVLTAAAANLNPPDGFFATIKPAPTAADIIAGIITSTPDLTTLATSDKEYILQNGTPDQAAKVWDVMKGKSYQFPGALVIASTPTQLQVALSDDSVASKTADFTFNLKAPEEATGAVAKAAAAKTAAAVATASAVGQTITLSGTFDSFTPKPLMITMTDGEVVLPKAAAKAPVHHTGAKKK
jgi:tetratricopeptide (TPR) repeat protein